MPETSATATEPVRGRSKWKRRLAILALLAGAGAIFHGTILRSTAAYLVVEDPRITAQALLMVGGESRFDEAAKLHENGAHVILLLGSKPGRLERLGILEPAKLTTRRELLARGIPESDLLQLSDEPIPSHRVGAVLCDWLREHPRQQIDVLCERFSTRKWRFLLRRSADPDLVSRIHLVALPHHQFDETNWWRTKPGQRAILNAYLRLGFTWWHDGLQSSGQECTQADFESAFARKADP